MKPFRKEFKLTISSDEPLTEADLEAIKDALAVASGLGPCREYGWLLEDGTSSVDPNKLQ